MLYTGENVNFMCHMNRVWVENQTVPLLYGMYFDWQYFHIVELAQNFIIKYVMIILSTFYGCYK